MKYIKGDLIKLYNEGSFDFIAHQCNVKTKSEDCAGIAKVIFNGFSKAANENNKNINKQGVYNYSLLGSYSFGNGIFNIYSQFYPGAPTKGIDSFECRISYLKEALVEINKKFTGMSIGLPLLASGLAKSAEFKKISDLTYFKTFIARHVEKCLTDMDVTIVYL